MAIKFSMVEDFPVSSRVEETKKPQRTQRAQRKDRERMAGIPTPTPSVARFYRLRTTDRFAPEALHGKGARPKTPAKKIGS